MKYPDCAFMETVYADGDVLIQTTWRMLYVYHKVAHITPFGNYRNDWLSSGTWVISADRKFLEQDGVGYLTGRTATTIGEIVEIVKGQDDPEDWEEEEGE